MADFDASPQLRPNAIVRSPLFPEPVKVILTQPVGADLRLIGTGLTTGRTYQPILSAVQLATLLVSPERQPFDGDSSRFRLGVEALRLGLAYEYDPYFALSIARIDPLPHQLEAVYHYFLKSPRIRFLLADDPGAGKTIMAGLLIQELKARGLIKRILIVAPANLTFQWQRKLRDKFGQQFEVVRGAVLRATYGSNPWQEKDQVITSVSWVSRIDDAKDSLLRSEWDLVIVDEAHKMSAYRSGADGKENKTLAYQLGEALSQRTDHGLLMTATPHKGDPQNFSLFLRLLMHDLLATGVDPARILYVPFDDIPSLREVSDPILAITRWFETAHLGRTFNESAREGRTAYILLDEVQNLDAGAPQIKQLVDNHDVRVLVTGSSSLRIEAGRDSLAGRITTVDLGPLLLREIAGLRYGQDAPPFWADNGLENVASIDFWRSGVEHSQQAGEIRRTAFSAFSARGAYPIAQEQADVPWPEMADYLNETIIKRAIQHDLRMGPRGQKRDEKLLEEVFRLSCRYAGQTPGQAVFVPEIQQAYAGNIGWTRILSYLRFLDGTLLIRLIQPLELRLKRKKSPSKICLSDHSLRASRLQEIVPLDPVQLAAHSHLTDLAGHLAEQRAGVLPGFHSQPGHCPFPHARSGARG